MSDFVRLFLPSSGGNNVYRTRTCFPFSALQTLLRGCVHTTPTYTSTSTWMPVYGDIDTGTRFLFRLCAAFWERIYRCMPRLLRLFVVKGYASIYKFRASSTSLHVPNIENWYCYVLLSSLRRLIFWRHHVAALFFLAAMEAGFSLMVFWTQHPCNSRLFTGVALRVNAATHVWQRSHTPHICSYPNSKRSYR